MSLRSLIEVPPMPIDSCGSPKNGIDQDDGDIAASMETHAAIDPTSSIVGFQVDDNAEADLPLNVSTARYHAGSLSPSARVTLASAMAAVGGVLFGYDTGQSPQLLVPITEG